LLWNFGRRYFQLEEIDALLWVVDVWMESDFDGYLDGNPDMVLCL